MNKEQVEFLKQTHDDCRKEVEMRIQQRDNFSIQFIIAVAAICAVALTELKYASFLFFLLPFVTIFYTVQILYSYKIHDRLHKFLVEEIEPKLASELGYDEFAKNRLFWESYCENDSRKQGRKTPGIRKGFFKITSKIMPAISSILFAIVAWGKNTLPELAIIIIALVSAALFTAITFFLLYLFDRKYSKKNLEKFGQLDYIDDDILKEANKKNTLPRAAVFLDRDGTIHYDKVMTHNIEDLEFFDDTFSALKRLQDLGFLLIVVTNQNGIKDGLYTERVMSAFNRNMIEKLREHGVKISAVYYSPHNAKENHISFKPNFGMFIRAMYELNINLDKSFMIGDQTHDMEAAKRAGVKGVMVTTGIYKNGTYVSEKYKKLNPVTVNNLTDAAIKIENMISEENDG